MDPCRNKLLTLSDEEVETTYSNTNIEPTINGIYTVVVVTEDEVQFKRLVVKSLYAIDADSFMSGGDLFALLYADEIAKLEGYSNKEEWLQVWAKERGFESFEDFSRWNAN